MSIDTVKNNIINLPPRDARAAVSGSKEEQIFRALEKNQKTELSNNGKFDKSEAKKNFWNGFKKPFQEVVSYAKASPGKFAALSSISIGLMVLSAMCPPVALGLTIVGCGFIGVPLFKGLKQVKNAKNGDDKEKAFSQFGESATYALLTFGPSTLSKVLPSRHVAEVSKAAELAHKGSGHTMNFFSNATNVTSFGPSLGKTAAMAGKGIIGEKVSYTAGR